MVGPALVTDAHSTTIVAEGWRADVTDSRALRLTRTSAASTSPVHSGAVELELFAHRLTVTATQMGELLQRTALSTNVKERLDFSCALLDAQGRLVVNAPHIPVHLGSLGLCVRAVAAKLDLAPGDVAVTNHPAAGGSHLPDITVVAPVHDANGKLVGYVANRAHHAELGGRRPGSMPPDATCLADEGVVIAPRYLVRNGRVAWDELRELLGAPPHPSRNVEENIADLRAQLAAVHYGREALAALAASLGAERLATLLSKLSQNAAEQSALALAALPPHDRQVRHTLDDGSPLALRVTLGDGQATFDFRGSAGVHAGNLNATPAIVHSAVLYVLRLLIDRPLPLNEGLLAPVRIVLEPGILDPLFPADPRQAPAVVGGNVETSQRLVNLLLEALELQAGSQGTMNNLLFGNERFGYYETICGGGGAGPSYPGAHAVHTHMTNTRCTDVEILEHRYPVRLEHFARRRGSGGVGQFAGGDGAVRELTFLAPLSLSLLGQHRQAGPRGLAGGGDGAAARVVLLHRDGTREKLPSAAAREVEAGDRLSVETPGGGGWGR